MPGQDTKKLTHICDIEFDISGHRRSTSSLRRVKAKLRRAGSCSERKPTRPAAEVRPAIAPETVYRRRLQGFERLDEA
jgi:hypothetical protein